MSIESIIDFIIKTVPGIVAAFVAARLAVNKFYKEKSWERREKAYAEIINSLYNLIKYFRVHKEDYGQGTGLSEHTEAELYNDYVSASSSLAKATDIGSFYISSEANAILSELRNRKLLDYREEPMFEVYESEYQAHQSALNKLLVVAKKDLKIK
ncbi:MAG TPA: hypothetical protein VIM59_14670 [Cellvibrio sp.]